MNHVGDTPDHHISDCAALVVLHYVLKRPGSQVGKVFYIGKVT